MSTPKSVKVWTPIAASDAECAFPAGVAHLMPDYADIPDEFRRFSSNGKWNKAQREWFYFGLANVKAKMRDGIDEKAAWRHLQCIQGSWEPKHEHKEAAVAYLMSLWFEEFEYERATKPEERAF